MSRGTRGYDLIAVGTSAGGFDAVCRLVRLLPDDFAVPVVLVQHRARDSDALASLLQECTRLRVCEVEDKQPVEAGHLYIAPPDYHLLIDGGSFSLSTEEAVRYSRPSIDVFFESAADAYGARLIGIVLTGANADGALGLAQIVTRGGSALIQDPATAEVSVMPERAREMVPAARVLSLEGLAAELSRLVREQPQKAGRP